MLDAPARKTGARPFEKRLDVWEMLAVLGKSILDFGTSPILAGASTAVRPEPHWTGSFFSRSQRSLLTSISTVTDAGHSPTRQDRDHGKSDSEVDWLQRVPSLICKGPRCS